MILVAKFAKIYKTLITQAYMKIMTVMGTRPEIIRLSVLLKAFENYGIDNFTIYTNQNFHESLSTIFIEELGVKIDHFIDKCPNTDLKK